MLVKFTAGYLFLVLPLAALLLGGPWRVRVRTAAGLLLASTLALWGLSRLAYLGSISSDPWPAIASNAGKMGAATQTMIRTVVRTASWALPSKFVEGLLGKWSHGSFDVKPTYLLGQWRLDASRLYFPVALLVKTPLPVLVTAVLGVVAARRPVPWRRPPSVRRPTRRNGVSGDDVRSPDEHWCAARAARTSRVAAAGGHGRQRASQVRAPGPRALGRIGAVVGGWRCPHHA